MASGKLTHIDEAGNPRMVDVAGKEPTLRTAVASGTLRACAAVLDAVASGAGPKGPVASVAATAAIMAAKRTGDLIPMCHPLQLDSVDVAIAADREAAAVTCRATVKSFGRTGVEMEALTAVHVGLLTVYDMCKAIDRSMEIASIKLISKSGGKQDYQAPGAS